LKTLMLEAPTVYLILSSNWQWERCGTLDWWE